MFCRIINFEFLGVPEFSLQNAQAFSIAVRKKLSFVVKEELSMETALKTVSQMAIFGPSRRIFVNCSKFMFFFFVFHTL